jgi:hypothetical protein
MSRMRMHRRDARRALALGVGLSLAAHAAAFAFVRLEISPLEPRTDALRAEAVLPTPFDQAPELIVLDLTSPAPRVESATPSLRAGGPTGGAAAPAAAASTAAPAVSAAAPVLPVTAAGAPTYDQLVVMKPVRAIAAAVPFEELTVAQTTPAAATAEPEVAVYVPGSIGKAKRGWASSGEAPGRAGDGAGWSFGAVEGRGDGHCPMPERGGRMPPPKHPGGGTVLR